MQWPKGSKRKRREILAILSAEQEDKCAICKTGCPDNLDHDHKTGLVRGVLCLKCNMGLGYFEDNPDYLAAAIIYLREHV